MSLPICPFCNKQVDSWDNGTVVIYKGTFRCPSNANSLERISHYYKVYNDSPITAVWDPYFISFNKHNTMAYLLKNEINETKEFLAEFGPTPTDQVAHLIDRIKKLKVFL